MVGITQPRRVAATTVSDTLPSLTGCVCVRTGVCDDVCVCACVRVCVCVCVLGGFAGCR